MAESVLKDASFKDEDKAPSQLHPLVGAGGGDDGGSELSKDDLDEAFDSIILAEEVHRSKGFKVGLRASAQKQVVEGFSLGAQKGFEIGSEVGIYQGFAETWTKVLRAKARLSPKQERALKVLDKILEIEVPLENPKVDADDEEAVDQVLMVMRDLRAKFKRCQVLLDLDKEKTTAASEDRQESLDW